MLALSQRGLHANLYISAHGDPFTASADRQEEAQQQMHDSPTVSIRRLLTLPVCCLWN